VARASIGIVGKVPAVGDFLRLRANSEAFQALYGWLIDSVQHAAAMRGDWAHRVPEGSVQALCYRSRRGQTALAGAITPSADAAGRRFPIVAASELPLTPDLLQNPEALPLVLESVWEMTSQLVIELQQSPRDEIEAANLSVEVDVSVADALATYRRWTEELPFDDFLALVFEGDPSAAAGAFGLVEEAVQPYRGVENPDTGLTLRLPLGQAGGAAVCFWIDLIERLTGWRRTAPSFFWSHDGASGALMLHLGKVPPVALVELWLPTGNCDEVCDLVLPPGSFRSSLAGRWERIIAEPSLAVSDVLRASGTRSPRGA